eukprot:247009-Rhodomonas_salina.1
MAASVGEDVGPPPGGGGGGGGGDAMQDEDEDLRRIIAMTGARALAVSSCGRGWVGGCVFLCRFVAVSVCLSHEEIIAMPGSLASSLSHSHSPLAPSLALCLSVFFLPFSPSPPPSLPTRTLCVASTDELTAWYQEERAATSLGIFLRLSYAIAFAPLRSLVQPPCVFPMLPPSVLLRDLPMTCDVFPFTSSCLSRTSALLSPFAHPLLSPCTDITASPFPTACM